MTRADFSRFLLEKQADISACPVVTGFDGFVDEMISVVDERASLTDYTRIETIDSFGATIAAAAGHSSLREIVINEMDPGGCAVNMGDGLANLGLPVTTFATVGEPMHPAFAEYARKARLISWGDEPGRTLAFEFADGKLMFSAVTQLQKFHPDRLRDYLADGVFAKACSEASLIAITDWTLYPHMTECWSFLREEVFSKLPSRPRFFFDLVDPSSRSEADIREMTAELSRFARVGEVTLGLNQNEANILSRLTGKEASKVIEPDAALRQSAQLRDSLGIDAVVIHAVRYAVGVDGGERVGIWGPYCENPKKSTGAGDRFNAGYVLASVLGCALVDRLVLGTAVSGYFVRHGESPSLQELSRFLETPVFPDQEG